MKLKKKILFGSLAILSVPLITLNTIISCTSNNANQNTNKINQSNNNSENKTNSESNSSIQVSFFQNIKALYTTNNQIESITIQIEVNTTNIDTSNYSSIWFFSSGVNNFESINIIPKNNNNFSLNGPSISVNTIKNKTISILEYSLDINKNNNLSGKCYIWFELKPTDPAKYNFNDLISDKLLVTF